MGTFSAAKNVLVPFPDLCLDTILSRSSIDNSFDFMSWFLHCHALPAVGPIYRQVCAFPNQVQSIEFTTGELQSSCRNISRMINGNKMHLSSILSLVAKGLNTYVNKVFFVTILVFSLSLWGIVCRLMEKIIFKNQF